MTASESELDGELHIIRRASAVTTALSGREREILELMAAGWANAAICEQLWLSPRTVESHIRNIFMKLDLPPGAGSDRRVVAVVAYLHASSRLAA